jgi:hypothetical protein
MPLFIASRVHFHSQHLVPTRSLYEDSSRGLRVGKNNGVAAFQSICNIRSRLTQLLRNCLISGSLVSEAACDDLLSRTGKPGKGLAIRARPRAAKPCSCICK